MAVHVPVMAVMGALKAIQHQADTKQANNRSNAELQRHMLDLSRLKVEAQMADRQHQREVVLRDRQNQRQSEALVRLASLSSEMVNMKTSAVMQVFEGVKEVLLNHQSILGAEKAAISQAELTGTLSGPQHVLRMKRQRELDRELAAISAAAIQLGDTAFSVISQIESKIGESTKLQIEDLRDVTPD